MGHDKHFLSRLDRVSREQCDLALNLYRDQEIVQKILEHAKLPDSAARVAISMDHPHEGPFVIVARDGHFVTCLGRGMTASNLAVVTRADLDRISGKVLRLREALRRAREVAPSEDELARLLRHIGKSGHTLSREDFNDLALWSPMMGLKFFVGYLESFDREFEARRELLLDVSTGVRVPDEPLRDFWNRSFGRGHLALLGALGDPEPWKDIGAHMAKTPVAYTRVLTEESTMSHAVKTMWIASHIGEPLLAAYENVLFQRDGEVDVYDAILGLGAIAATHEDLDEEVARIFQKAVDEYHRPDPGPLATLRAELIGVIVQMLEGEQLTFDLLGVGNRMVLDAAPKLPPDSEYRFANAEDIPPSLAVAAAANILIDPIAPGAMGLPLALLPFIPAMTAGDLYLPRGLVRAVMPPWERVLSLDLLGRPGRGAAKRQPARAAKTPGRNDPCSCGSGKKYKKCHGA